MSPGYKVRANSCSWDADLECCSGLMYPAGWAESPLSLQSEVL